MATPPSPHRRKVRSIRPGDSPDDLLVVVRATPAERAGALDAIVATAAESAGTYLVSTSGGVVELLFGVSVFALRRGVDPRAVLSRFPFAPTYVAATVGAVRAAGLPVLATGSDPRSFRGAAPSWSPAGLMAYRAGTPPCRRASA